MSGVVNIKEVQRDFGRAAATYDAYATLQREVLEYAVQLLAPFLRPEDRVLDAGCGTGRVMEFIPHGGIIGIDIAQPMCALSSRRGMATVCADMRRIPLSDACMHAVLCSLAMQWVPERHDAFAEFFRVMRPGGHAVIATFGERTLEELRSVLPSRVHIFPSFSMLALEAEGVGWHAVSRDSYCYTHYYSTFPALMHSLKAIGAANKLPDRPRGLTTPSIFQRAGRIYQHNFSGEHGLSATWEVHYLLLRKP